MNKFDLVCRRGNNTIYVVLSDEIQLPYFEDGVGSEFAKTPLDFTNPEEWKQVFSCRVCFDTLKQDYEIIATHNLEEFSYDPQDGYIPYDQGTGQLRCALGLMELAEKLWKKK